VVVCKFWIGVVVCRFWICAFVVVFVVVVFVVFFVGGGLVRPEVHTFVNSGRTTSNQFSACKPRDG